MSFVVVIPARYASTRLPGKPLVEAGGKPLIQWVHEAACRSAAERVVVATDDQRVVEVAERCGAEVWLTGDHHASGADRICEAAERLGLDPKTVIVNLQGDEPGMPGALIDQVARTLAASPRASIATAAYRAVEAAALTDPNIVKVVLDRSNYALYFSRSRIPCVQRAQPDGAVYCHLGLYAYRYEYLRRFTSRRPTMLERTESLEQLRALEYGDRIAVHVTRLVPSPGIDTPEDLERFRRGLDHAQGPGSSHG